MKLQFKKGATMEEIFAEVKRYNAEVSKRNDEIRYAHKLKTDLLKLNYVETETVMLTEQESRDLFYQRGSID